MLFGIAICAAAAALAAWLGALQSYVGAPMLGLFIGILAANMIPQGKLSKYKKGVSFSSKYLLKAGIILAGCTISFQVVLGVGLPVLPLTVFNICLSFAVTYYVGRRLGVSKNTCTLVGGGTAICGGTAIATLAPIVGAKEDETAYAMNAIFLFNILSSLIWPYAAHAMGLTAQQYGILGGLAISDTSSVTATAATYDALAGAAAAMNAQTLTGGDIAVVVKLMRTVMLVFVAVAVILVRALKGENADGQAGGIIRRTGRTFPLFVLGFLAMAAANTIIGFSGIRMGSVTVSQILSWSYKYLITCALVSIGLKIRLAELLTKGLRPILLGGCSWAAVAAVTLAYVVLLA